LAAQYFPEGVLAAQFAGRPAIFEIPLEVSDILNLKYAGVISDSGSRLAPTITSA